MNFRHVHRFWRDVFYVILEIMYINFVANGQTVNKDYYLEALATPRERVRKIPEVWKRKTWIYHHDNASSHTAQDVKMYLAMHGFPY